MKQPLKIVTAVLAVLCLILSGVGLAPNVSSTFGSPIAKAARTAVATGSALEVRTNSNIRYIKWWKVKVYNSKSEAGSKVELLRRDAKVRVLSGLNNSWVRIKTPSGKKGYVMKRQLTAVKVKDRTWKTAKKQWAALEPALVENGWRITEDQGYEYMSGLPGWVRIIWARKNVGDDTYSFNIRGFAEASIRGGTRENYMFWVFKNGSKIAQSPFSEPIIKRESLLDQIYKY